MTNWNTAYYSKNQYAFMEVLKNYSNWRTPGNILVDAYGKGITECQGYFDEKLGVLKKRGIIGLWEVLDNVNRNNLLQAIRRYEEESRLEVVEDGKFWAENVTEKPIQGGEA